MRAVLLEDPALAGSTEIGDNSLLEGFTLMRDLIPQVQASGMLVDDLVDAIAALSSGATGRLLGEDLCPDTLRAMAEGLLALDVAVLDAVLDGTLVPPSMPPGRSRYPASCWRPTPASSDAVDAAGAPRDPRLLQPAAGDVVGAGSHPSDAQLESNT